MDPLQASIVVALAFACEYVDSTLGMGYGTILSPLLIISGLEPLKVVPAILLSQGVGGMVASSFHHRFRNIDLGWSSRDAKVFYIITGTGILATVAGVVIAANLPTLYLKTYIGVLVLVMGGLILSGRVFSFSWRRLVGVGVLSSFNKALSGGGFGPVVTSGQIISGIDARNSIGVTTLAEVPICIASFCMYLYIDGFLDFSLLALMTLGAALAAPLGAYGTRLRDPKRALLMVGLLTIGLGVFTLIKTHLP